MQISQVTLYIPPAGADLAALAELHPHLVLAFGAVRYFSPGELHLQLRHCFPDAEIIGCSTAGEIGNDGVSDDSLVVTALRFDHPGVRSAATDLQSMEDSAAAGARLGRILQGEGLHNVLVLGQGVNINGSALLEGFRSVLPEGVIVSGGLAGDGGAFQQTWTVSKDATSSQKVVAIGFYDAHTQLAHGSFGGWRPFGPARKVTRARDNILYELDGEPALEVYKRYLGEYAKDLPASGLLFPFEMLGEDHSAVGLIRTILGIDEHDGSLTLAGDIIEHGFLRLMHASTDSLVDGAEAAAEAAYKQIGASENSLALLVSCVGRKLVMGARVEEEVEAVAEIFGGKTQVAGFYSYGEMSPLFSGTDCKLHNQTMTITHLSET